MVPQCQASMNSSEAGMIHPVKEITNQPIIIQQEPKDGRESLNCTIFSPHVEHPRDFMDACTSTPVTEAIVDKAGATLQVFQCSDELWDTVDKISFASEQMKQELEKSQKRELALALELQNLKYAVGVSRNGSGDTSQTRPDQTFCLASEARIMEAKTGWDLKSKHISELEDLVHHLQNDMVSLKDTNLHLHREMRRGRSGSAPHCLGHIRSIKNEQIERHIYQPLHEYDLVHEANSNQFELMPSMIVDKSALLYCAQELGSQKEELPCIHNKLLNEEKFKESCEFKALANKCAGQNEPLHKSSRGLDLQLSKLLKLEEENILLKMEVTELKVTMLSVTEENSKYKSEISKLEEEKKSIQAKLSSVEEDGRESIKKLRKMLAKYENLKNHSKTLVDDRQQLFYDNENLKKQVDGVMSEKQKVQENMTSILREIEKLKKEAESSTKKASVLMHTNRKLESEVFQFKKEASILKTELEKYQLEAQDIGSAMKSERERLLHLIQKGKDEKLNLEKALQDAATTAEKKLKKQVEQLKEDRDSMEKKLLQKMKQTEDEKERLKNSLSDVCRECDKLSQLVTTLREDNLILKQDLEEHIQGNLKLESIVKRLREKQLMLENSLLTLQYERKVLKLKVQQFYQNHDGCTATPITGCHRNSDVSDSQNSLCDLFSKDKNLAGNSSVASKDNSVNKTEDNINLTPEEQKIEEIRRKIEKEELQKRQSCKRGKKPSGAFSFCSTMSVMGSVRTVEVRQEHTTQLELLPNKPQTDNKKMEGPPGAPIVRRRNS
nr:PREDICTED: coiled-coil domain-containing protein 110 [Latimeria chalumnae]|eukprot:XP_014353737.1 PREDICTED: coiled-coil domain-containing protein 110 [Latimeria chalumnae]